MVTINPLLDRLAAYPAEALHAQKVALEKAGMEVFDFSVGDPIEETDAHIVEAFRASVPVVSQYPTVAGLAELRQACADWYQRRFGLALDVAREVLPTSGSKEAIFHLPLAFLDARGERRRVLFGEPAYPVYERGTLFAGGEPWPVELRPEKGYRLEPWALPADLIDQTAIVWVNYPHNPTAATVDLPYFAALATFCREHDILLCSDECYVDLYFDTAPPPSLLQVAREGVLAFHSLSKRSGMTGYRAGFVAGDPALIGRLRQSRANFGVACTEMVQRAAIAAWRDDGHVAQRRATFRQKRDVLSHFLAEAGIEHAPCEATLYLWVRTPADADPIAYAERLAQAGILVSPAPLLGVDQPYVRLALVPSVADCARAADVWRTLL